MNQAVDRIVGLTGLPAVYPDECGYLQMAVVQLPAQPDLRAFKFRLYDEHQVEVPCIEWGGRHWLRISVQGYNTQDDIDRLVAALESLLR